MHVCMSGLIIFNFIFLCVRLHIEGGLKSSYGDIISAVADFFDQWDQSTATLKVDVCGHKENYFKK